VTERLADGQMLVLGRTTEALEEVTEIVTRAMALAIIPALVLSVIGGTVLSRATLRRVEAVHRACRSIMEGHFDRRLPLRGGHDEFDRLAVIVNTMLNEIERLMTEVKGAGDAIAHDLRTPLTRLRARLERSVAAIEGDPPVKAALQKSLGDIDQLLVTVAALMRIAEVEQSRRRENFESVDLGEIVTVLTEFYQPIAEENGLAFVVDRHPTPSVEGDGDLLFEALANLVDNAIKFTPEGGKVGIDLASTPEGPIVQVWDNGPGIPKAERGAVLRRFYRVDRSRHLPGTGLGLSLVAAIVRLHSFSLALDERPDGGCRATLLCSLSSVEA
jgi:signal transduction histidine kinase